MKRFSLVLLAIPLLSIASIAQTPSPSSSLTPTPTPSAQTSPTPSPQSTPCSTTVKITTSGIELVGFPTWIIAVVIVVGLVAFVIWFKLLRSVARDASPKITVGILALVVITIVVVAFGGYRLGRWDGNQKVHEDIAARGQQAITVEVPNPTPQPTPVPTPEANEEFWRESASLVRTARVLIPVLSMFILTIILVNASRRLWESWRLRKKY